MLSNQGILSAIKYNDIDITPFDEELLNPGSYDLTLGSTYRRVPRTSEILDLCRFEDDYSQEFSMGSTGTMILMPGECVLAITRESIFLGKNHCAEVCSKSSMGRLFQTIHAGGAGFCDAGFSGHITLEIVNFLPRPVIYTAGMRVAQIVFSKLDTEANPMYNAKGQYSNADCAPIPAKRIKRG